MQLQICEVVALGNLAQSRTAGPHLVAIAPWHLFLGAGDSGFLQSNTVYSSITHSPSTILQSLLCLGGADGPTSVVYVHGYPFSPFPRCECHPLDAEKAVFGVGYCRKRWLWVTAVSKLKDFGPRNMD